MSIESTEWISREDAIAKISIYKTHKRSLRIYRKRVKIYNKIKKLDLSTEKLSCILHKWKHKTELSAFSNYEVGEKGE